MTPHWTKGTLLLGAIAMTVTLGVGKDGMALPLYSQPVTTNAGFYSNIGGQIAADQFVLGTNAAVTGVTWYGFYGTNLAPAVSSVDFQVAFFADASGVPGTGLASETLSASVADSGLTVTGLTFGGSTIYQFDATLSAPLLVDAGDTVWLSLAENDAATPAVGDTQWLWSFSTYAAGDTKAERNTNPALETDWESVGQLGNLAFTIDGTPVPEPATWLLMGAGLVGLAVWRRRRAAPV